MGLVGLMSSWHRVFGSILWVRNFFSRVFSWSKVYSRGYFVRLKFFLMGILWVQSFFSWLFRGSNFFFVMVNFVIQRFSVIICCMRMSGRYQKYINPSKTTYSIPSRFHQLSVLVTLEKHFIY